MNQPQAELIELYRANLKSASDLMKTSLESVERLQSQQFGLAVSFWGDWLVAASENQRQAMQQAQESARAWLAQASKTGAPTA